MLTVLVYLVMVLWSLPKISEMAGGATAFDLRPFGYSFEEARSFLIALGSSGADFYLNKQQLLDSFYPAMLGVVLVGALIGLDRRGWGWVLSVFAIASCLFDYLENAAVHVMLLAGGEKLTPEMVEEASGWTLLKSINATIAMTGLLVLILISLYQYFFGKKSAIVKQADDENSEQEQSGK